MTIKHDKHTCGYVQYAKERGKLITYDPNYRPLLWATKEMAIEGMRKGLQYADVIKVSEEEAELLTGESDTKKAGQMLLNSGVQLVCITLGGAGSFFMHTNSSGFVAGFDCQVVDTTGAGDSFFGSVVHQIVEKGCPIAALSQEELQHILKLANCAASLCIEEYGGIPSIPSRESVMKRLNLSL